MNTNMDPSPDQTASSNTPSPSRQDPPPPKPRTLPFSNMWPLVAGAISGIVLRLVFSARPGSPYAAMNGTFILLAPFVVGAVTVYVAETQARRSWGYYAWASALANLLFIGGTMAILIEGLICAIIIAPLFAVSGAVGGLVMGAICRITHWPKQAVLSVGILPLVLGALPPNDGDHRRVSVEERTILVQTSADHVWQQLHNTRNIQPREVGRAWMYRIGVPLPIAGVTQETPTGLVRKITMGKSIHFDQTSTEWEKNRYVRWQYRFDDNSFPPGALDDHVRIGGHYFDLLDTEYILVPRDAQTTALTIRMHYRVSTQFDWYAKAVAKLLIGNFEEVILGFYRQRALGSVGGSPIASTG